MQSQTVQHKEGGFVTLAGAGPGDPELITLKLQRRLQEADIIISDRLVHPDIISRHAKTGIPVILAGKQGYNAQSYTREEVAALIVREALQGKRVLRLKGGDVAFFSNVLDELEGLVQHEIPFEIIPGITAASGFSAYTGIPLTARGYAQGVRFIAFNPTQAYDECTWRSMGSGNETLVIYMAARNIGLLAKGLMQYEADPRRPVAVIEQASTPAQQLHLSTLGQCAVDFSGKTFSSPSLVIIGEVLRLGERFRWFEGGSGVSVFRELGE
ncbi:MAG: uroporphyrinogen-III C-methyltransferase [Sphingobacteriales bacterium]|nr:uroporphyrinogen-III C-methyltransferase [Sphingobacteriales bacterium]